MDQESKESTDRSSLVSDDGKNSKSVLCQRCGSKVLCPGTAVLAEKEVWRMHSVSFDIDRFNISEFLCASKDNNAKPKCC